MGPNQPSQEMKSCLLPDSRLCLNQPLLLRSVIYGEADAPGKAGFRWPFKRKKRSRKRWVWALNQKLSLSLFERGSVNLFLGYTVSTFFTSKERGRKCKSQSKKWVFQLYHSAIFNKSSGFMLTTVLLSICPFFETKSHCLVYTGFDLTMWPNLASNLP